VRKEAKGDREKNVQATHERGSMDNQDWRGEEREMKNGKSIIRET
jgi:hypothetical protein